MAVELEKIASLLEDAYENISSLEQERDSLLGKIAELEEQMELQKEASTGGAAWSNDDVYDMGSASDFSSNEHASAESRLDDFLLN